MQLHIFTKLNLIGAAMETNILKENLKKIRKDMGLSVAKFSERINIPAATIVCWERGDRIPSANLFMQLHSALNINLNWFVTGMGDMYNPKKFEQTQSELAQEVRKILREEGLIK